MLCPHCHAENKYDALTCDFCMEELPMTEERKELIKKKEKFERSQKLKNSKDKIFGMLAALLIIVAVIVVVVVIL